MTFHRKTYAPLPGSIPYRAIEHLARLPKDHPGLHTAELAEAIGHESNTLAQLLRPARQAGMLIAKPNVQLNGAPMRWRFVSHAPVQPPAAPPAADDDTDCSVTEERQIIRPAAEAPLPEGVAARPPWPFGHVSDPMPPLPDDVVARIDKLRAALPPVDPESTPAQPGTAADIGTIGVEPGWAGMDMAKPGTDKTVVRDAADSDWSTALRASDFNRIDSHSKRVQFDVLGGAYREQQSKPLRTAIWDDGSVHLVRGDSVIAKLTRDEALALRRRLFAITGDAPT